MATFADMLSIPSKFEFEGVSYELRPPTQLEQGIYQRWLEQEARESIDRATYLSDAQREMEARQVTRDIAAGLYEFGGEISVRRLQTVSGIAKLIEVICKVDAAQAQRVAEGRMKLAVELVRGAQAKDPKAMGEALAKLGLPKNFLNSNERYSSKSETRRSKFRKKNSRR